MRFNHLKEWIRSPSIIIVLRYLKNNSPSYATKICKDIHMTYITVLDVLKYLSKRKLIYKMKDKRKKYIYLTNKGKEIAMKLEELDSMFNVTIK